MLTVTDQAVRAIRELTQQAGLPDDTGIRIAANAADDGQPAYGMEIAPEPLPTDMVVESEGARVFLDPVASAEFEDKELDAEIEGDTVRFQVLPSAR